MALACQRDLFRLPDSVAYLNCSYMSPQLQSVEAAGREALLQKNEPFRQRVDGFFEPIEQLKSSFARVIQSSEPERIALVPAVSYGMATVAHNLTISPGQNIVLAAEQFPSNYYTWERVCRDNGAELRQVEAPQTDGSRRTAWNEALLSTIDSQTALVAVGNIHWADGTLFDLMALRQRTREVGAWLVIDGTQSIGALPIDVDALQPDALVAAGYKWLMGPYAIGFAYYGPAFDHGTPIEENWINRADSHDFKNLVRYRTDYRAGASRYSVGEHSNFMLVPMMQAALDQVLAWGVPAIQQYCKDLVAPYLGELAELGIHLEANRAHHLLGLYLGDGFDPTQLKTELESRQIHVSLRGEAMRVAPNVYNRPDEVEQLIEALKAAKLPQSAEVINLNA